MPNEKIDRINEANPIKPINQNTLQTIAGYKLIEIAKMEGLSYMWAVKRKAAWKYIQIITWTGDKKKPSKRYIPYEYSKYLRELDRWAMRHPPIIPPDKVTRVNNKEKA